MSTFAATNRPTSMETLESITRKAELGTPATIDEALRLNETHSADELADAADRVRVARMGNDFDTCSIVNARSGRCSEDCKWCAQSRHFNTGVETYDIVPDSELTDMVDRNTRSGIRRFSMVTSGRRVSRADIDRFCDMYREFSRRSPMKLCASMGLLEAESLAKLREAGVTRYHCNLETAASFFPTLCSTHTRADKLRTIRAAREAGLEVCSGGIIGMGETMRQRLEMAAEARDAGAVSIPVNLLNPIPGTPLASQPLISEDEAIRTMALMRLVAPDCAIRFAGGRARISRTATERLLRGGVNGAIVGDMLTTPGNSVADDFNLFHSLGFTTDTNH